MIEKFNVTEFNKNQSNGEYHFILESGSLVRQLGNSEDGYQEIITKPSSMFDLFKEYYPNCQLKMYGERYKKFFLKGIWHKYDMAGNLIETTDYDEPFKFSFDFVLIWIQKQNINVNDDHFKITRYIDNSKPKWVIQWLKNPEKIHFTILDGINGDIIEEGEMNYINN